MYGSVGTDLVLHLPRPWRRGLILKWQEHRVAERVAILFQYRPSKILARSFAIAAVFGWPPGKESRNLGLSELSAESDLAVSDGIFAKRWTCVLYVGWFESKSRP